MDLVAQFRAHGFTGYDEFAAPIAARYPAAYLESFLGLIVIPITDTAAVQIDDYDGPLPTDASAIVGFYIGAYSDVARATLIGDGGAGRFLSPADLIAEVDRVIGQYWPV